MKDLYIIGAGGFGKEVAWLVERINEKKKIWNIKGFIDDEESRGDGHAGYPIVGSVQFLKEIAEHSEVYAVCAIGTAQVRKQIIERLKESNVKFAVVVDPSVVVANRVKVGEGAIICANSVLAVDSSIGNHVIINLSCVIGHDDVIEDFVTVHPGVNVSGNVTVGNTSELGTGTKIIQGKTIVPNTIVGAGAVVIKDITESGTYVGVPAKKMIMKREQKMRAGSKMNPASEITKKMLP